MRQKRGGKEARRGEKTCKPKADSNKLIMQHKMQTFMNFMKLAEALKWYDIRVLHMWTESCFAFLKLKAFIVRAANIFQTYTEV